MKSLIYKYKKDLPFESFYHTDDNLCGEIFISLGKKHESYLTLSNNIMKYYHKSLFYTDEELRLLKLNKLKERICLK